MYRVSNVSHNPQAIFIKMLRDTLFNIRNLYQLLYHRYEPLYYQKNMFLRGQLTLE